MAGRICKHEGCGRPLSARGMCKNHYEVWRRKNPDITVMAMNEQVVLECMPGTLRQLVQRSGLCISAVERAIAVMHVDGPARQVHIADYVPPAGRGKRWEAIYKEGRARDMALTKKRRLEHSQALRLASNARLTGRVDPPPAPACWAHILGIHS